MRKAWLLCFLVACGPTVREGFGDPAGDDDDETDQPAQTGDGGSGPAIVGEGGSSQPSDPAAVDEGDLDPCDADLAVGSGADDFVKAIGLCQRATEGGTEWGVLSAGFFHDLGSGDSPAADPQHGVLPKFGDVLVPREGARLGVLSTGYALEFDDPSEQEPFGAGTSFGVGAGQVPDALGGYDADAQDLINLRIRIRVPSNAHGFSFDFDFHTSEWPVYVGSEYNDRFVAWVVDDAHPQGANLSFDSKQKPVSVNAGFFDRCVPNVAIGCDGNGDVGTSECPAGPGELAGTGFGLLNQGCGSTKNVTIGGATGWLTTEEAVTPGEIITLEIALWDEHDANWDSLAVVDNFRWKAEDVQPGTHRPPN